MTADTLVPEDCTPLADGFGLKLYSLSGEARPLRLADAVQPDGSLTWIELVAGPGGSPYGLRVEPLPPGYASCVVVGNVGDTVCVPRTPDDLWPMMLFADAPDVAVARSTTLPPAKPRRGLLRSPRHGAVAPRGCTAVTAATSVSRW